MIDKNCFICGTTAQIERLEKKDAYYVKCGKSGNFYITGTLARIVKNKSKEERFKVSTYIKECDIRSMAKPYISSGDKEEQFVLEKGTFEIGWDRIISEKFPHSISERLDRTLINFSKLEPKIGKWWVYVDDFDYVVAYAEDGESWEYILKQLQKDDLIEIKVAKPGEMLGDAIRLTPKGWNRIAELERGGGHLQNKQAFVAMWFDKSMDEVWERGFKPAIEEDSDIKALRVDLKEHNEKICDVIIAEIRRSKFIVADFTGNRSGVYFEAGFAKGLGIPVIFCCQKGKWIDELHFDTRQYNHIIWENPGDLKEKLKNRIRATMPITFTGENK